MKQQIIGVYLVLLLVACQPNITFTPPPSTVPATQAPQTTVTSIPEPTPQRTQFDGQAAFLHLEAQMALGERYPGSPGHLQTRQYIIKTVTEQGWQVELQNFDYQGFAAQNIIAKANVGQGEIIILAAHYDTRKIADQTPGAATSVPGAVDGASGVAVLLELAETLQQAEIPREVWLVFFDLEDNGSGAIPGWDWIVGSTYMASNLTITPEALVLVDMVGDADQQLYYEGNSDPTLQAELWQIAADLGYRQFFIPEYRHNMIDDHLPFVQRGIVAVDIIDFDYSYWHTVEDDAGKASPDSLERVGRTLQFWLEKEL